MIVYRCTACTHDHATLSSAGGMNDEPRCQRCGLTAFCQITLPDEPGTEAPPPIQEIPGQSADDYAKAQAESGEAETMDVAALRPSEEEEKDRDTCGQVGCWETATHRFTWPGHPERSACPEHAQKATRIAHAMGFFLEVPAL